MDGIEEEEVQLDVKMLDSFQESEEESDDSSDEDSYNVQMYYAVEQRRQLLRRNRVLLAAILLLISFAYQYISRFLGEKECSWHSLEMDPSKSGTTAEKGKRVRKRIPMKKKAQWDLEKHALFVKLCLEQHRVGNKPAGCLNRVGYENLMNKFKEATRDEFTRDQFKNHWDNTKKDWTNWTALKKEMGMGWDAEKGTYSQTDEWWTNWAKSHSRGEKFKDGPLPHEEELDELFLGFVATREHVYIPSAAPGSNASQADPVVVLGTQIGDPDEVLGTQVGSSNLQPPLTDQNETKWLNNFTNHILASESTTSSTQDSTCPPQTSPVLQTQKSKKQKTSGAIKMAFSWDKMVGVFQQAMTSISTMEQSLPAVPPAPSQDPYSIENCMKLLCETDVVDRSPEWYYACIKFEKKASRMLFVSLGNAAKRAGWVHTIFELRK